MHCGAEVTESSTNKQHHLSLHIRPYFIYFYFRSQATFISEESSETILLFVDSRGSEVSHVPLDVRIDCID
jgi:hypothetical protein